MSSQFHERAKHTLGRTRRYNRLTPYEIADYLGLLDIASRPPTTATDIAERAGFVPSRVGVVLYASVTGLSRELGLGHNSKTLPARLERYAELGLAAVVEGAIILRPGGVVRLDDHRAGYETDEHLFDGQPYPPIHLPGERGSAQAIEAPAGQLSLGLDLREPAFLRSPGDHRRSPGDHETIYRDQKMKMERARGPEVGEPEGLDELVRLASEAAAIRADGVVYQVSAGARRHLAQMVRTHGLEACRAALHDIAPRYVVPHPIGWLGRVLARAQADVPADLLEEAVRDCVPPEAHGRRRQLAAAERAQLTALIAEHGRERIRAALPAAAGCGLPVAKLAKELAPRRQPQAKASRPEADDRAAQERAVGGRPESAGGDARTPDEGPRGWSSAPAEASTPEPASAPAEDAEAAEAWAERAPAIRTHVTAENWRRYFAALVAVGMDEGEPELAAADAFVVDWIDAHYGRLLGEAGVRLAGRLSPQRALAHDLGPPPAPGNVGPPDLHPRTERTPEARAAMSRLAAWAS